MTKIEDIMPRATNEPSESQQIKELMDAPGAQRSAIAASLFNEEFQSLQNEWKLFESAVVNELQMKRNRAAQLREMDPRGFRARIELNQRRVSNSPEIRYDAATGEIMRHYKDGHVEAGITMGISSQAARTAGAHLNQREFEFSDRFFEFMGRGDKQENAPLGECLTTYAEYHLVKAKYEQTKRKVNEERPKNGVSWLRMMPIRPLRMVRGPDGQYQEQRGDLEFRFDRWPVQDVLVTNPERPYVSEQEGVFFIKRGCTLQEIIEDEATYDLEPNAEGVEVVRVGGRFINLDGLREADEKFEGLLFQTDTQFDSPTIDEYASHQAWKATSFNRFDLVEYEGSINLYTLAMRKIFTPRLAALLNIEVGFEPEEGNRESLRIWGQRLNRLKEFRISYVPRVELGDSSGRIIEFGLCPYANPKKSLYAFSYFSDSDRIMGESVTDRIKGLEDAADFIVNRQLKRSDYDSNPAIAECTRNVQGVAAIKGIQFKPGARFPVPSGMSAQEAYQVMQLPNDERWFDKVSLLTHHAYLSSGVAKVQIEGTGTADTLGGQQMEQAQSQLGMDDIFLTGVIEASRLIHDMVEICQDYYESEGPGGFLKELVRVCGADAARVKDLLLSATSISNEFAVVHPAAFHTDPAVTAASMRADFTTYGGPLTYDTAKWAKLSGHMNGIRFMKNYLISREVVDPESEQLNMAMGNKVDPNPAESPQDFMVRMAAHQAKLMEIMQSGGMGVMVGDTMLDEVQSAHLAVGLARYLQQGAVIQQMMEQQIALNSGQAQTENTRGPGSDGTPPSDTPTQTARNTENEHRAAGPEEGGFK